MHCAQTEPRQSVTFLSPFMYAHIHMFIAYQIAYYPLLYHLKAPIDVLSCNYLQVRVEVTVVFLKIGEIDTLKENYEADVMLKSRWREPLLDKEKEDVSGYVYNSLQCYMYISSSHG